MPWFLRRAVAQLQPQYCNIWSCTYYTFSYGARQARTVKLPKHLKWTGPEGEKRVEKRAEKGAAVKRDSKIPAKYKQFSVS